MTIKDLPPFPPPSPPLSPAGENAQIDVRVAELTKTWEGTPQARAIAIKAMREKDHDNKQRSGAYPHEPHTPYDSRAAQRETAIKILPALTRTCIHKYQ